MEELTPAGRSCLLIIWPIKLPPMQQNYSDKQDLTLTIFSSLFTKFIVTEILVQGANMSKSKSIIGKFFNNQARNLL